MTFHAKAIHDAGVLRLLGPLPIGPQQLVDVAIQIPEERSGLVERTALFERLRAGSTFRMGPKPTRDEMNER